jgi:hypothetical protein
MALVALLRQDARTVDNDHAQGALGWDMPDKGRAWGLEQIIGTSIGCTFFFHRTEISRAAVNSVDKSCERGLQ